MKLVTNWRNATVSDIETDGLLDELTKMHVLSYDMIGRGHHEIRGSDHKRLRTFFHFHIDNKIPIVFHNGILFDIPACEEILDIDLSDLMVIDTLIVSWYLNAKREAHGLDTFFRDYGIVKPKIDEDDWCFESDDPDEMEEHYERMRYRCHEDVRINKALWEDFIGRLEYMYGLVKEAVDQGRVDGTRMSDDEFCYIDQYKHTSSVDEYIDRILTYLMFKMDCVRLQEVTRVKLDVDKLYSLIKELEGLLSVAKEELEAVMPIVPKYAKRTKPKEPFKKDGSLSVAGIAWNERVDKLTQKDEYGNPLAIEQEDGSIKELNKYEPPNINSTDQIKKFLFKHGWKPVTFKYVEDKEAKQKWVDSGFKKHLKPEPRKIPQVNVDGDDGKELCQSVVDLAEEIPEIMAYSKYTLIKHRYDMCKGFERDMSEDGYVCARINGITSTLRMKHKELVNLPSVDKPYGKDIRGMLIAEEGYIMEGSDLSSLEDRIKHHFMLPHDPEYVATMMEDDFDPHILMALTATLITQKEFDDFKGGNPSDNAKKQRRAGKSTNYASVYNAGPPTIARSAGVSLELGKRLHTAYWDLNWSVKKIAEELCVITTSDGLKWIINPINGFCYNLRKESDRFSALCQGTGAFMFDMWVDNLLTEMWKRWKKKVLQGQFHDEFILSFKDLTSNRNTFTELTNNAIEQVNETFKLRRPLGCDVQFGNNYSQIH